MDESKDTFGNQFQPFLRFKSESGQEDVHYSILYEGLPEEYKLLAEKELKETNEKRERGIVDLKEFMESQNVKRLPNTILLAILRSCKYDLKKSKSRLKTFASNYSAFLDELAKLHMDKIEKIVDDMGIGALPYRDKYGRVIAYTRPWALNLEAYDSNDLGPCSIAIILFLLSFPITTVAGFVYFAECDAPTFSLHYPMLKSFRRYVFSYLPTFPARIKRIDVLNIHPVCRWFYNVIKPLVPKKLISRVFFHGSGYEGLNKHYNPKILPDVFGGTMGRVSCELYKSRVLDYIRELRAEAEQTASLNQ